jgi:tetratricopeptide (TPR) repeat protein
VVRRTGLLIVLLLAAGLGGYAWHSRKPVLPTVDLDGVEPAIVRAVEEAQAAVVKEPRSAAAWGKLGLVLRAHALHAAADRCFAEAQRLDPEEPRWPYFRGLRLSLVDAGASLPLLRRAALLCERREPANTAPRLRTAEVLLELGQNDEARDLCERVLKIQPNNPRVLFDLGLLAMAQDDLAGALRYFTRCADSPFTHKQVAFQLATLYQRQGDARTAAEFSRRARHAADDLPWVDLYAKECQQCDVSRRGRLQQIEEMEREGDLGASIQALHRLAEEAPDEHVQVTLGLSLIKLGDFAAAQQAMRSTIAQFPESVRGHFLLSLALFQQAEKQRQRSGTQPRLEELYRAAAASARRATELQPDHAFAYLNLGLALKHLGRRDEALAALRQAQRCKPEVSDPYYYLGEALAEQGQELEALRTLQQAIDLAAPGDTRPALTFARIWIQISLRKLLG